MHANDFVPVELLVQELWGSAQPPTAKTTVQTYVMQIRKLISRALAAAHMDGCRHAKQELVTMPGGYRLTTVPDGVDRWRFERLATEGHAARERADYEAAAARFAEALACWRGEALVDVQVGAHLAIDRQRLEESRLNVLDCRMEADLQLGRHHQLIGELTALVRQYPRHERLTSHLMVALYRSGRRCDALEAYQQLHRRLNDVGLEPSPQLRKLHRTVLACDRGSTEPVDGRMLSGAIGQQRTGSTSTPPGKIPASVASIPWRAESMTQSR